MKFFVRKKECSTYLGVRKQDVLKRKRQEILDMSKLKEMSTCTHTISLYPIMHRKFADVMLPSPHWLMLHPTLYLQHSHKTPSDITTSLPYYNFTDTNTASFVKSHINPHVTRYETTFLESAYLLQAIFDKLRMANICLLYGDTKRAWF